MGANNRYTNPLISLHWLMVLLIVGVYTCMELHGFFPKGSYIRESLKTWHFMLGLSVFVLVWIRLIVRLKQKTPSIEPAPPKWQTWLSTAIQIAFYGMMIAMPIIGWLILSAEGKVIPFYGLSLPALIAKNKDTAHFFEEVHEIIGTTGYFLIGLHAIAALYHHYFRHDNVLQRMLFKKN